MVMANTVDDVLRMLGDFQVQRELSIIKLSEPILAPSHRQLQHDAVRSSDVSTSENPTSASLETDLMHYKELFTKLRFSYVEQVTKEKFLRAVVGDPPLYVDQFQNVALETQLLEVKASLKVQKAEVAEMIAELERQGRELSRRYQIIQLETEQLQSVPGEIAGLKSAVASLKAAQTPESANRSLSLPLPATLSLLSEREAELEELNLQLATIESTAAEKMKVLGRLEDELKPFEEQKANVTRAAKDARRRKAKGMTGAGDELEERGRWLRGVERTMKSLLEV